MQELAAFLPAIAAISHDERQAARRLLMSSNSMDFETLQQHQKVDAQLVKVRNKPPAIKAVLLAGYNYSESKEPLEASQQFLYIN